MNIANLITLLAIASGLFLLAMCMHGRLDLAGFIFPLILLFDKLDGMAARKFNCSSKIGEQLDSLSDAFNFGVLIFAVTYVASDYALIVALSGGIFALAAVWRLARFNAEDVSEKHHSFRGLPSTNAAAWVFVFLPLAWFVGELKALMLTVLLLIFATLMVGRFSYDNNSKSTLVLYGLVPASGIALYLLSK